MQINSQEVRKTLANANEMALSGKTGLDKDKLTYWGSIIQELSQPKIPKTYLAVFAVVLTARAMHAAEHLDVTHIKAGSSALGYSAPSIGSEVASFAKAQDIDLRARSSQPMNNHPFTFKDFILPEMGVKKSLEVSWKHFYDVVQSVNRTDCSEAIEVLALLFDRRRRVAKPKVVAHGNIVTLETVESFKLAIHEFVTKNSENGKIGQAFAAAALSCVYPSERVLQGGSQDPDASLVGDVHLFRNDDPVIFVEVKQKPIGTGEVKAFISEIAKSGGDRVFYLALNNMDYTGHINEAQVLREALKNNVSHKLYTSALGVLEDFIPFIDMPTRAFPEFFALEFLERLNEADVSDENIEKYKRAISSFISFT